MYRPSSTQPATHNAMVGEVALRTAIILLLLAALIAGILHFSTSRSDSLALQKQSNLMRIAFNQNIKAITRDQEASTFWDDAVLRTAERPLDLEWIDNNLGVWFHTYYKHDETYLLDASGRPLYAMRQGHRAKPFAYFKIAPSVEPLAHKLRLKLRSGYAAPEGSDGKSIGIADVAMIGERPAFVSIKPIVSETGDIKIAPASENLHVSIRYLDADFLRDISNLYGMNGVRFSRSRSDGAYIPVTAADGRPIGYILWTPFQPGRQVEDKMVPVLLASLLIIGIVIGLLLLRIRRSRLELEASRAQAQHLAFHDSLTGLPNRALFHDRLEHALSRRSVHNAVLLLDLDRFKNINDTLGHQAGDELIRQFGLRLAALTREADTIARLGGDEFAILLEDVSARDAERLAARILKGIKAPFELMGSEAYVGVSIGIALTADGGRERLELVRKADIALYQAKDGGRDGYCRFSPDMDESIKLRSMIEDELRHALSSGNELCLHYQPQVGADGAIVGLEALVRWEHPTRGLVPPEQFVPIAEECGLIIALGEWVAAKACQDARRWHGLFVSINLSPLQLRSSNFVERLLEIVRRSRMQPASIQLEVTERVLLDDDPIVQVALASLRRAGFKIALDDFGTGYSSLGYLRKFEVDKIKIDKSFIQHLGDASDSRAIVSAVLALGHAMGLKVSAEGVEKADQRNFLEIAGCKEMQGYYFSKAVPAEQVKQLLAGAVPTSAAA